ncbi:hypothetical protein PY793_10015 [Acetobacter fabarum]|uniref:hypothetical protein n=1 Tax=Acetobacter fabarum TaxID=483199 RepID=UPI00312B4F4E
MSNDMAFFDGVFFDGDGQQPFGNGTGTLFLCNSQDGWMIADDYGHPLFPIIWEDSTTVCTGGGSFSPNNLARFCQLTGTTPHASEAT